MSDLSRPRPEHLDMLVTVDHNIARLLPLLNLLDPPDGLDRVAQMLDLLRLILDMQQRTAAALKDVADKVDRLSRR